MPFLAALLPAVVGAVGAIGGAMITSSAANKATAAQEAANARVDEFGRPYREAGTAALGSLEAAYGLGDPGTLGARRADLTAGFESSPLYKYTYQPAIDEATKAANASGSAGGFLDSGRTLKAIQDRAARIGGQTFGNYLSGIDTMASRGQNAAFGSGSQVMAGTDAANQGRVAGANALTGALAGVGNAAQQGFQNYNYLKGVSSYAPNGGVYGTAADLARPGAMAF